MNTEDLEKDLRNRMAATGLQQRNPTAAWKQDILREARVARERGDAGVPAAPRWLLIALGAAWCLIVMLRVTTPASGGHGLVTTVAPEEAKNPVTSPSTDDLPLTALGALLAINAQNQPSEVP